MKVVIPNGNEPDITIISNSNFDLQKLVNLFNQKHYSRSEYFKKLSPSYQFSGLRPSLVLENFSNEILYIFNNTTFAYIKSIRQTFPRMTFSNSNLEHSTFDSVTFKSSKFDKTKVNSCKFYEIKQNPPSFVECAIKYSDFVHSNFTKETPLFQQNTFEGCGFYDVGLHDKFFTTNNFTKCIFINVGAIKLSPTDDSFLKNNITSESELLDELRKFHLNPNDTTCKITRETFANALFIAKTSDTYKRYTNKEELDRFSNKLPVFRNFREEKEVIKETYENIETKEPESKLFLFYNQLAARYGILSKHEAKYIFTKYAEPELATSFSNLFANNNDFKHPILHKTEFLKLLQLLSFESVADSMDISNELFYRIINFLRKTDLEKLDLPDIFYIENTNILSNYAGISEPKLEDSDLGGFVRVKKTAEIDQLKMAEPRVRNFIIYRILTADGTNKEKLDAAILKAHPNSIYENIKETDLNKKFDIFHSILEGIYGSALQEHKESIFINFVKPELDRVFAELFKDNKDFSDPAKKLPECKRLLRLLSSEYIPSTATLDNELLNRINNYHQSSKSRIADINKLFYFELFKIRDNYTEEKDNLQNSTFGKYTPANAADHKALEDPKIRNSIIYNILIAYGGKERFDSAVKRKCVNFFELYLPKEITPIPTGILEAYGAAPTSAQVQQPQATIGGFISWLLG